MRSFWNWLFGDRVPWYWKAALVVCLPFIVAYAAIVHMGRETMNPRNNRRMFTITLLFVVFCVAMSMLRVATA